MVNKSYIEIEFINCLDENADDPDACYDIETTLYYLGYHYIAIEVELQQLDMKNHTDPF